MRILINSFHYEYLIVSGPCVEKMVCILLTLPFVLFYSILFYLCLYRKAGVGRHTGLINE